MNPKLKSLLFAGPGTGSVISDVALAVVRVCTGLLIALGHGKGKLFHDGTFGIPEQLIQGTAKLGFPAPTFFAWCSVLTEFLGGILLAIGLFDAPGGRVPCVQHGRRRVRRPTARADRQHERTVERVGAALSPAVPAVHLHRRRPLFR